jgi:hypothetical protein
LIPKTHALQHRANRRQIPPREHQTRTASDYHTAGQASSYHLARVTSSLCDTNSHNPIPCAVAWKRQVTVRQQMPTSDQQRLRTELVPTSSRSTKSDPGTEPKLRPNLAAHKQTRSTRWKSMALSPLSPEAKITLNSVLHPIASFCNLQESNRSSKTAPVAICTYASDTQAHFSVSFHFQSSRNHLIHKHLLRSKSPFSLMNYQKFCIRFICNHYRCQESRKKFLLSTLHVFQSETKLGDTRTPPNPQNEFTQPLASPSHSAGHPLRKSRPFPNRQRGLVWHSHEHQPYRNTG